MIDGINIKDYQVYVCYDKNQYQSDKFDGCYKTIGYVNASTSEKYISKFGYDAINPLIALPIETNGNNTTYMIDYYWAQSGNRIALVGGAWPHSSLSGLWCWNVHYVSSVTWESDVARLLKTS